LSADGAPDAESEADAPGRQNPLVDGILGLSADGGSTPLGRDYAETLRNRANVVREAQRKDDVRHGRALVNRIVGELLDLADKAAELGRVFVERHYSYGSLGTPNHSVSRKQVEDAVKLRLTHSGFKASVDDDGDDVVFILSWEKPLAG
jgi:hypothetical protein